MEIEELREYVILSRTMNFTKTAHELHLSQSALSNHVMKMERELGVELIDRAPGRVRFTFAGYAFLETASKIVNQYDEFIQECISKDFCNSNHFIVQTLQHADRATHVILKRIEEFKAAHPEVQIEIRESMTFDAVENIKKGLIDCGYLGISLTEPSVEGGFKPVPVLKEKLVVWLDVNSPQYRIKKLQPKDLEGLEFPTWVGLGQNNGLEDAYREIYDHYGIRARYSPRYCISREDFFLNKIVPSDAVILTEGSELIHSISVRDDRALREFDPPIYVNTYMVFKESETSTVVRNFEEYLTIRYREDYAERPQGATS